MYLCILSDEEATDDSEDASGNKGEVLIHANKGAVAPELQQLLADLSVEGDEDTKEMDLLELLDST